MLGLSPLALMQSTANGHTVQAGDFRYLLDATVPILPGQYAGE